MAIGDEARAAKYPLVPDTGEEGRIRWGARELNRTRDFIAQVGKRIPIGKAGYRTAAGITASTTVPANSVGANGDIHFKILP